MGRRMTGLILRALWKGVFVGSIAAFVLVLVGGALFGAYGLGSGAFASPLVALSAGLFAFLWALRPESDDRR